MAPLSARERNEALLFYFGTAVATLGWWVWLAFNPEVKPIFFGEAFSQQFAWLFFAPDMVSAVVIAPWCGFAVAQASKFAGPLAWIHFGAQGYALVMAIGLAVIDPGAYWGGLAMAASAGLALIFAMRIHGVHILWGPFDFNPAPARSVLGNGLKSVQQTVVMWGTFLILIPLVLVLIERSMGWDVNWFSGVGYQIVGVLLFLLGGTMGIAAMVRMVREGDGTPLPTNCANRLVTGGIYSLIRNPMSFGGTIQGFGIAFFIGSPLIIVYSVVGIASWEVLVRHLEEGYLLEVFGDEYAVYLRRVSCYLPRLGSGAG